MYNMRERCLKPKPQLAITNTLLRCNSAHKSEEAWTTWDQSSQTQLQFLLSAWNWKTERGQLSSTRLVSFETRLEPGIKTNWMFGFCLASNGSPLKFLGGSHIKLLGIAFSVAFKSFAALNISISFSSQAFLERKSFSKYCSCLWLPFLHIFSFFYLLSREGAGEADTWTLHELIFFCWLCLLVLFFNRFILHFPSLVLCHHHICAYQALAAVIVPGGFNSII